MRGNKATYLLCMHNMHSWLIVADVLHRLSAAQCTLGYIQAICVVLSLFHGWSRRHGLDMKFVYICDSYLHGAP